MAYEAVRLVAGDRIVGPDGVELTVTEVGRGGNVYVHTGSGDRMMHATDFAKYRRVSREN